MRKSCFISFGVFWCIRLYMMVLPLSASAQTPVVLTDEQGEYPLGLHLEYLEDPGGTLTIEEVASSEYDDRFLPSQQEIPRFGLTDSAYWLRFQVMNSAKPASRWYLEYDYHLIYSLDVYVSAEEHEEFSHQQSGRKYPFPSREIPYHSFVFPLQLEAQQISSMYLRVECKVGLTVPLTLWSAKAFGLKSQTERLLQGISLGIIGIMACYNAFLFGVLREKNYGWYALFLFSLIFSRLFMSGLGEQYLFPHSKLNISQLFLPLAYMALLAFSASFLEPASRFPAWGKGLRLLIVGWGILEIIQILSLPQQQGFKAYTLWIYMVSLFIFLTYAAIVILAAKTWLNGYRPARYFFPAILVNFISPAILLLNTVFGSHLPNVSQHLNLGRIVMILLFSFALIDRINLLKEEREHAYRSLQDYREHLEVLVESRTGELRQLNQDLETRVEEELGTRRQQEQLLIQKSKLESLGRLAAGITHEINQPLTRIALATDMLLLRVVGGEPLDNELLENKYHFILDSIHRIAQIIEHIKIFFREHQTLRSERIDVNVVVNDTLLFVRTQFQHHNIAIETDFQAKGMVLGSRYRLEQVVLNILSNARDAIEQRAATIEAAFTQERITIRTFSSAERLFIEIADSGVGIAEDVIEHIFDPFFTTKSVGKGTGLGLSISYGIIKDMRGDMSVTSKLNKGTTFTLSLPKIPTAD